MQDTDANKTAFAADRIEAAVHRFALLLEDGYGGNGLRLIEALEKSNGDAVNEVHMENRNLRARIATMEKIQRDHAAEVKAVAEKHDKITTMVSRFAIAWKGSLPESWSEGFVECGAITIDLNYPTTFIAPVLLLSEPPKP